MKLRKVTGVLLATASFAVFAQAAAPAPNPARAGNDVQRDVNQQQRIENGLKDGSLTTREAASLEKREGRISQMEANAMRDGTVTKREQARINRNQNAASQAIYNQRHDAQSGNPDSAASQRMQADVQRDVNQETRIQKGLENGSLTGKEAASLERGQARVERLQAKAGSDGAITPREQRRIQRVEARQSQRIYNRKHNAQVQ